MTDGIPYDALHPIEKVTLELTSLARERYLTDSGERPFPFAEDLAGILAAVNTRVGGTDALFEGQEGNTRTPLVTSLIADGSEQRPAQEDGRCRMAIGAMTELANELLGRMADDGRVPFHFADELATALSDVARNLGGIEELLSGQPVTPNTTAVAGLLGTSVPDPPPAHRSEPIRLLLDVNDQFDSFGPQDNYHYVLQGLQFTDETIPEFRTEPIPEDLRRRVKAAQVAIQDEYSAQKATYVQNYTRTAQEIAKQLRLHAPIEVISGWAGDPEAPDTDPLTRRLDELITQATVVPATGLAPRDHPGRQPVDLPGADRFLAYVDDPEPPVQPSRHQTQLSSGGTAVGL